MPLTEGDKQCHNTAVIEGSATALMECLAWQFTVQAASKGTVQVVLYGKLVFFSIAIVTLTKQKQETSI